MPENHYCIQTRGKFLQYSILTGLAVALGLASPQQKALGQEATGATVVASSLEAKAASQTSSPSDLSTEELMTLEDLRKFARIKY